MRAVAAGSRDAAGLADALASMEKRLARMQARLDELDADIERQRREKRELDVEIAIRRGALELLGKELGADPENLTNREKTILVKQISEAQSVSVKSLLPVVGPAHSTYHYQLNAMRRPDRDAWLLPLVEEAFENSEKRYGYKRVHLELQGMGITVSAKRVMKLMTSTAWCRCSRARSATARTRASSPGLLRIWSTATSTPTGRTCCG